jgi:hypothetical protein
MTAQAPPETFDRMDRMKVILAMRNLLRSQGQLWISLCGIVFAARRRRRRKP